jgi:hypothetical protein
MGNLKSHCDQRQIATMVSPPLLFNMTQSNLHLYQRSESSNNP